jgi:hypothetical protein
LVERLVRNEKAWGSNPHTSTTSKSLSIRHLRMAEFLAKFQWSPRKVSPIL